MLLWNKNVCKIQNNVVKKREAHDSQHSTSMQFRLNKLQATRWLTCISLARQKHLTVQNWNIISLINFIHILSLLIFEDVHAIFHISLSWKRRGEDCIVYINVLNMITICKNHETYLNSYYILFFHIHLKHYCLNLYLLSIF